jgi:hypothetical protein
MQPGCEMVKDCPNPVTHIGSKGYVYCTLHAPERKGWEGTRKMRKWEIELLKNGQAVPSYKPMSRVNARKKGLLDAH